MSLTDEEREELIDEIQSAVEEAVGDSIHDSFEDVIEDSFEELRNTIEETVEASVQNAIQNMLADFQFVLPNGTHVLPRKRMSLISPDKTKVFLCYGGLRVVDSRISPNVSWELSVQTRIDSWETICSYSTKEEATAALEKVQHAISDGLDSFSL